WVKRGKCKLARRAGHGPRPAKVEVLGALGRAAAGEKIRLIVAVEMVLIGPVAELHAPEELLGDVRISRRSHQRGEPVEAGEDPVLDRAGLDPARPADDRRPAEATFADGTLGVAKSSHDAIRPCENFGGGSGR